MPGNTATIIVEQFRRAWDEHIPIRVLCSMFTITRDQVTRLKFAWHLTPRHDRRLRRKPSREERFPEPDLNELAASEASLDLAPMVAERATCVHVQWTEAVRTERQAVKAEPFRLARVETPDEFRDVFDDLNSECEW